MTTTTQKLQVATDALKHIEAVYRLNVVKDGEPSGTLDNLQHVIRILAAPSTEQQAATADSPPGAEELIKWINMGALGMESISNRRIMCDHVRRLAAIQAAPAGDAVAAIVDRAIPPMTARVVDHDINGRPIYSNDPLIATKLAATQPAREVTKELLKEAIFDKVARAEDLMTDQPPHKAMDRFNEASKTLNELVDQLFAAPEIKSEAGAEKESDDLRAQLAAAMGGLKKIADVLVAHSALPADLAWKKFTDEAPADNTDIIWKNAENQVGSGYFCADDLSEWAGMSWISVQALLAGK